MDLIPGDRKSPGMGLIDPQPNKRRSSNGQGGAHLTGSRKTNRLSVRDPLSVV